MLCIESGGEMAGNKINIICKNIFKSSKNNIKQEFTQIWAKLINRLERTDNQQNFNDEFTNRPE